MLAAAFGYMQGLTYWFQLARKLPKSLFEKYVLSFWQVIRQLAESVSRIKNRCWTSQHDEKAREKTEFPNRL